VGAWIRAIDPAVACGRQISEATSDSDGPVVGAVGAIPVTGAETGVVSVATAFDGRLLVGLVGAARGG
jgi:hypothetical protein